MQNRGTTNFPDSQLLVEWREGWRPHLMSWLVLAIGLAVGLVWSWGTWPDVIVDGGRELYVPWRLTEGDVLYRDLRTFNGPLSPYVQAAWFSVFGVSLRSLAMQNLLVIVAVLGLLYHLLRQIAGFGSAVLCSLTFVALFAFSQFESIGCANWMFPYSHELTHGITLSLAMVACLMQAVRRQGVGWMALGGACLGMAFLTKAEVFLAAACAATVMVAAMWLLGRIRIKALMLLLVAALLPVVLSVAWFSRFMPLEQAMVSTAGTWPHVFHHEHRDNMFFKWCMGTLDTHDSLRRLGLALLVYAGLVGMALALSRLEIFRLRRRWGIIAAALLAAVLLVGLIRLDLIVMADFALPWQVFLLALTVWVAKDLWRWRPFAVTSGPDAVDQVAPLVGRLGVIVLALALLAKIALYVRIWQYGFGLAMPAAMVVLAAAWDWLPAMLQRRGLNAWAWRGTVLGSWLVVLVVHLMLSQHYFARKTVAVGEGVDRFWADGRGSFVEHARGVLSVSMEPDQTLTVMPEGVMLNYLLRASAPTPDTVFILPVVVLFGEETLLAPLKRTPPDWLVLIHQDSSGYGARYFTRDFAQEFGRWVHEQYVFSAPIGAMPFQGNRFGVIIGKRRDLVATPSAHE